MNFSDKIKFQREQNHLTQKGLAELVGVSQRAIAAYESSGTIACISTMRKLAHGQLGEKAARDINNILEANRALFAGGELDEEAKDAFYQAVTKAYLSCKMEAKKHLGEKRNQRKNRRCRIFRTPLLLHYNL